MRAFAAVLFGLMLTANEAAGAQVMTTAIRAPVASQVEANTSGAFALEAGAGALGSLAGMAIIGLSGSCPTDNLECLLRKIGGAGALGVIGATIGTTLAARRTGSDRSIPRAALGAIVGTGAGLGIHYLLNSNSDRNLDDAIFVVPIFAISQGIFAAIGSRLF